MSAQSAEVSAGLRSPFHRLTHAKWYPSVGLVLRYSHLADPHPEPLLFLFHLGIKPTLHKLAFIFQSEARQ